MQGDMSQQVKSAVARLETFGKMLESWKQVQEREERKFKECIKEIETVKKDFRNALDGQMEHVRDMFIAQGKIVTENQKTCE